MATVFIGRSLLFMYNKHSLFTLCTIYNDDFYSELQIGNNNLACILKQSINAAKSLANVENTNALLN